MPVFPFGASSLPSPLRDGFLFTEDGAQLRYAVFETSPSLGTFLFLQGRGEFLERYFEAAEHLRSHGLGSVLFDWRDQGGSQYQAPSANIFQSFHQYDIDLKTMLAYMVSQNFPRPYYALSHSMGGIPLLRHLVSTRFFERAILASPFLGLETYGISLSVLQSLCASLDKLGLGQKAVPGVHEFTDPASFLYNPLTSNVGLFLERSTFLHKHPELKIDSITFRWLSEAFKAIKALWALPKGTPLKVPTLLLMGNQDGLVSFKQAKRFSQHITPITFVEFNGAKHELLQETAEVRSAFWASVEDFLFQNI